MIKYHARALITPSGIVAVASLLRKPNAAVFTANTIANATSTRHERGNIASSTSKGLKIRSRLLTPCLRATRMSSTTAAGIIDRAHPKRFQFDSVRVINEAVKAAPQTVLTDDEKIVRDIVGRS